MAKLQLSSAAQIREAWDNADTTNGVSLPSLAYLKKAQVAAAASRLGVKLPGAENFMPEPVGIIKRFMNGLNDSDRPVVITVDNREIEGDFR